MEPESMLDDEIFQTPKLRRRKLLPWWIKVFCWVFMVFGGLVLLGMIPNLIWGFSYNLALYGMSAHSVKTPIGLLIDALFVFKAIAAIGLWTEKDWAIKIAKADSIIGIIICALMTFVYPFFDGVDGQFTFRFELLILIPYLIKIDAIREDWERRAVGATQP